MKIGALESYAPLFSSTFDQSSNFRELLKSMRAEFPLLQVKGTSQFGVFQDPTL